MSVKSAIRRLSRAFAAKDANAFDDAIEELEEKVEGKDEEKEPDTIEVHNHIPGADGIGEMPEKDKPMPGARDDEQPEWFKKFSQDCMDRFTKMHDDIGNLQKWAKEESEEPEHQDDDMGVDPNLEMDRRSDDRRNDDRKSKDAKDDEANKKILGELEFEAPPGTDLGVAAKALDSKYLGDSFQDAVSKAEILAPGIRVPTFDRASSPKKTAAALFGLRRTALDLAYAKPETRGIIDAAMNGRTFDSKRMSDSAVRVLFNAVSSQVAEQNNARATDRSIRAVTGGGHTVAGKLTSLASINERNKERFGRKSA